MLNSDSTKTTSSGPKGHGKKVGHGKTKRAETLKSTSRGSTHLSKTSARAQKRIDRVSGAGKGKALPGGVRIATKPPPGAKDLGESHRILSTRLEGSLDRIIVSLSPGAAKRALEASGPITTIVVALEEFLREHPDTAITDPEALNATRLAAAKHGIIQEAGGLISTSEAAELLGISASAVRKRIERDQLLSIPSSSGEHRLPRAQFRDGDALPGLEEVLGAMHIEDPWMRTQLLLDPDVIGALREGHTEDAVRAVRTYLPRDEGTPGGGTDDGDEAA